MSLCPRARALVLLLMAGCGGSAATHDSRSSATTSQADCAALAAAYAAALPEALQCDPAAQDPCSAQRPLVVWEGTSPADAMIAGLCWTANAGYLDPTHTATLDQKLADYTAAGCAIAYCPGPSPHQPLCLQSAAGSYTCDG